MIGALSTFIAHIFSVFLGLIFITHVLGPAAPPEGMLAALIDIRVAVDLAALPYAVSADQFLQTMPLYPTVRGWFMDPGLATLNKYPAAYLGILVMVAMSFVNSFSGTVRISVKTDPRVINSDAKAASAGSAASSTEQASAATSTSTNKLPRRRAGIERTNPWRK